MASTAVLFTAIGPTSPTIVASLIPWSDMSGYISIDDEVIAYSSRSSTSFSGLTRGALGTIAATHQKGAIIAQVSAVSGPPGPAGPTGATGPAGPNDITQTSGSGSWVPGNLWVQVYGGIGSPGLAMGPLGLTYSRQEVDEYFFSWEAANTDRIGVRLQKHG